MNVAEPGRTPRAAFPAGYRVLMAEDVDTNAMWQKAGLEIFGCSVRRAADGAEALSMATVDEFDLILMDCHMPVMDGLAATQAIRHFESATSRHRTPIVAVTASLMPDERQSYLDAGMDDVLAKPFFLSELGRMLDRWARPAADAVGLNE